MENLPARSRRATAKAKHGDGDGADAAPSSRAAVDELYEEEYEDLPTYSAGDQGGEVLHPSPPPAPPTGCHETTRSSRTPTVLGTVHQAQCECTVLSLVLGTYAAC